MFKVVEWCLIDDLPMVTVIEGLGFNKYSTKTFKSQN